MSSDLRRHPVLLVDDQWSNRWVLQLALSDRFDIQVAASGAEALVLAEQTEFAVLVTDQRMPGMSGLELARSFQARLPRCERVIITGFGESAELTAAVSVGLVAALLSKPVHADQLAAALERLLTKTSERTNGHIWDSAQN